MVNPHLIIPCQILKNKQFKNICLFLSIVLLVPAGMYALDMPDRPQRDKSFFISAFSTTRLYLYDKERVPDDSATVYEVKSDKMQSLSLDLFQGTDRKFGLSSNFDLYSVGLSDFDLKVRSQILKAYVNNVGPFRNISVGRQNAYTGFNFYKIDGLSTTLALGKMFQISGFYGLQADSTLGIGEFSDNAGFLKVNCLFGYRSSVALHFDRALYNDTLVANDLGLNLHLNIQKRLTLNTKAQLSLGDSTAFSDIALYAQYRISRKHFPYLGYTHHNPVFTNPMMLYFFDLFNYHKVYGGWKFKPLKKVYLYFTGEYGLLSVHDLLVHNVKLSVLSPYADLVYTQRFGDLSGAGLVDISAKYPVHRMLTVGAGLDYARMEIINREDSRSNLLAYYGFLRFTPFKEIFLQARLEDRNDTFYKHDVRFLMELRIGYSNWHPDLFGGRDKVKVK